MANLNLNRIYVNPTLEIVDFSTPLDFSVLP